MFIPNHTVITAPDAAPRRYLMVLHGIYGRGQNWRSFATKLAKRRPDWGLVLVDLRMHGDSRGAPPPHTVAAAAADLAPLAEALADRNQPISAIAGHSFGGKVALAFRHGPAGDELSQTWLFDSSPSAAPHARDAPDNTVQQVLRMLEALPPRFASRAAFVDHVTGRGFAPALGHWLAMNLAPADAGDTGDTSDKAGGLRLLLDTDAMGALLDDYYATDAWPMLSAGPGVAHVVIAGASNSISGADRERLATLAERGAPVHTHTIPEASHWLHVDALQPLLDLVADTLD
ncbi:MAG: hypothetical protein Tsb0020_06230 [Haliangiales bacterium]